MMAMTRDLVRLDEDEQGNPGFEITCKKCGSKDVKGKNDVGGADSCGWGGIHLVCIACGNSIRIYDASW